jgi:hypothetical protein
MLVLSSSQFSPKVTFGEATCPNRGEKFFAPLADEIRTLSGAPHRRILKPTAIGRIVRRHTTGATGNSAPRCRIAYSTMNSVIPKR